MSIRLELKSLSLFKVDSQQRQYEIDIKKRVNSQILLNILKFFKYLNFYKSAYRHEIYMKKDQIIYLDIFRLQNGDRIQQNKNEIKLDSKDLKKYYLSTKQQNEHNLEYELRIQNFLLMINFNYKQKLQEIGVFQDNRDNYRILNNIQQLNEKQSQKKKKKKKLTIYLGSTPSRNILNCCDTYVEQSQDIKWIQPIKRDQSIQNSSIKIDQSSSSSSKKLNFINKISESNSDNRLDFSNVSRQRNFI